LADDGTVPDDCTAIVSLDKFDFVFQHSGNPETERAINCWENRDEKEKVVLFTGGEELPPTFQGLGIPFLPNMNSADSLLDLRWSAVPSDFNGTAEELVGLLKPKSVEVLSALSVLCQGYLAVHVEGYNEQEERWGPEEMSPALKQMGWSEDLMTIASDRKSDEVSDPGWWQVFDGEDDLIDQVEDEWGDEEALPEVLKELLTRIMEGTQLGDNDAHKIVADAYCKLAERLGGRPCQ
jgi:hypothetical protein